MNCYSRISWICRKKESLISTVREKVKTLLFWDELDLKALWNAKTEWLISDKEFKRMELYEELNEIKKNPDFPKFVEIFNLVKSEYDKDKNKDISEYINLTWIDNKNRTIFIGIYWEIIAIIIRGKDRIILPPGINNSELRTLEENDAFFALWERDFNL